MKRNSILLRRKNKVIVPRGDSSLPDPYVATVNKNLEGLGYTLSPEVVEALKTLGPEEAARFHEAVLNALKELRGVKNYRPMYPNFPRQVMEAGRAELYLNALMHYLTAWLSDLSGGDEKRRVWLPTYAKAERASLDEEVGLTVIGLGTEEELREVFTRVVSSNASISETDRAELKWFVEDYGLTLPDAIPNKEVLVFVGGLMPDDPGLRR